MIAGKIKELAAKYAPEIIEIRHHLHAHPELSYKEFETSAFVRRQLNLSASPSKSWQKPGWLV
jgi:hippurate hydrolase